MYIICDCYGVLKILNKHLSWKIKFDLKGRKPSKNKKTRILVKKVKKAPEEKRSTTSILSFYNISGLLYPFLAFNFIAPGLDVSKF